MDKAKLNQYRHLRRELEHLQEQMETIMAKVEGRSQVSGRRSGGISDMTGELAIKKAQIEELLKNKQLELLNALSEIENAIDGLPSPQRTILRMRYIDNKKWERICVEMNYSWRQIHRIHSDAFKKFKDH